MKFALNGALTIGTMDGANVEIREEVGDDNIFIFGLTAPEVAALRPSYDPRACYRADPELARVLDMIRDDAFSPGDPGLFQPLVDSLLHWGDHYLLLADYASYVACQDRVARTYRDQATWTRMSILNVAKMGKFSSDRTIQEYAKEIWRVTPVRDLALIPWACAVASPAAPWPCPSPSRGRSSDRSRSPASPARRA